MSVRALDLNRTYTIEEFETLPEFAGHFEFDNGRIIEKPMTGDVHTRVVSNIARRMYIFDPEADLGNIWIEGSFRIEKGWIPEPDLAFVRAERIPPVNEEGAINVVPDLVVEVLSSTQIKSKTLYQAEVNKVLRYVRNGVPLVWFVNPTTQTVDVYSGGKTLPVTKVIGDELSGGNILPNFALKLEVVFKK